MESKIFRGLAEAYAEIYAPQEIDEASAQGGRVTGSTQTTFKPTPTSPGSRRGAAPVPSSSSTGSVTSQRGRVTGSSSNNAFSQAARSGGTRRGAAAGVRGTSTTTAPTPAAKPAPTPTARPAASAPTARPAASAPTARPAATTPQSKPAPTTSTSTAPAAPKKTFNPLMQKTFGYQTGYAPDQVKKDPKKMAQTGSLKSISSGLDMFDLVKGHLLDEGYADTEEAAIAIMANMSEEWKNTIINNL